MMKALHSLEMTHPVTERHTPEGVNLHFQDLDIDGRTFKYTLQKLEAVMWCGDTHMSAHLPLFSSLAQSISLSLFASYAALFRDPTSGRH